MDWDELYDLLTLDNKEIVWKEIDEFINTFDCPEGCEAIIDPEGKIVYASPSHVEVLIKYLGEPREVIYNKMPLDAMPIRWLIDNSKCVGVWPGGFINPKGVELSEAQCSTIKKLIKSGLVAPQELY